jgi:hypothetical protein
MLFYSSDMRGEIVREKNDFTRHPNKVDLRISGFELSL